MNLPLSLRYTAFQRHSLRQAQGKQRPAGNRTTRSLSSSDLSERIEGRQPPNLHPPLARPFDKGEFDLYD
jgi:hypothetical protein